MKSGDQTEKISSEKFVVNFAFDNNLFSLSMLWWTLIYRFTNAREREWERESGIVCLCERDTVWLRGEACLCDREVGMWCGWVYNVYSGDWLYKTPYFRTQEHKKLRWQIVMFVLQQCLRFHKQIWTSTWHESAPVPI